MTKSVVKHIDFHATLYRVDEKLSEGQKVSFKKDTKISAQMLGEGWSFINNRSSAFSADGRGVIRLPKLETIKEKNYTLNLRYAVINASEDNTKTLTFTFHGQVIKSLHVNSHLTQETQITLPFSDTHESLTIEAKPKGQIMLRSITIHTKGDK